MKIFLSLFLTFTVSIIAYSQPALIDPFFNSSDIGFENGDGTNGTVNTSDLQVDGKLIIGGDFTKYNGSTRWHIARIKTDGKLDSTFDAGSTFTNDVSAVRVQSDGKILTAGGTLIKRFNSDGSLDSSFNGFISANQTINAIAIQNDGKILCGGSFTTINSMARSGVARLNANGSLDSTFNPGTGAAGIVKCIIIQPDSRILIGGQFLSYNGTSRNHLARIHPDGSLDTTFLQAGGANANINGIALQNDGKILAGGHFTSFTTPANRIVRLTADGSVDTTFLPGTGFSDDVHTITIQPDGKSIIGGRFTFYSGNSRKYIARLNTNGSVDSTFNPLYGFRNTVLTISRESSGRIIAGGEFSYANLNKFGLVGLNHDGTLDLTYNPHTGVGGIIQCMAIQNDGKIIIGGQFGEYNGVLCNNIARLNTDGSLDTTFDIGSGVTRNGWIGNFGSVDAIRIQNDGKILIAGSFYGFNGYSRDGIARINTNGSTDTTFFPGAGVNFAVDGSIYSMAIQSDGKILIGGNFETYNAIARNNFARINPDGSLDTGFNVGTGVGGSVKSIEVQSDGKILIGGSILSYNNSTRNGIARINTDGSLEATFTGNCANGSVEEILIQSDGKIIIAGGFTSYYWSSRRRIARINANSTIDTTFNPGTGADYSIFSAALQSDGKIIIAGDFEDYNGTIRNRIARINTDGSLDTGFDPGTGISDLLHNDADVKIQPDGKVVIGSSFTSYDGTGRNRILRLEGSPVKIEELQNSFFSIYPNPTSSSISIHLSENLQNPRLNIYHVYGSEVYSEKKISGNEMLVDCSKFSPGIYFIKVSEGEKAWTQKLVIQ